MDNAAEWKEVRGGMNLFEYVQENRFRFTLSLVTCVSGAWSAALTIQTENQSKILSFGGENIFDALVNLCSHISGTSHIIETGEKIFIPHLEINAKDVIPYSGWFVKVDNDKLKVES